MELEQLNAEKLVLDQLCVEFLRNLILARKELVLINEGFKKLQKENEQLKKSQEIVIET